MCVYSHFCILHIYAKIMQVFPLTYIILLIYMHIIILCIFYVIIILCCIILILYIHANNILYINITRVRVKM